MIVQWFLQALTAVVAFMLGLLPTIAVPSWLTTAGSAVSTVLGYASTMGAWIPLDVGLTVVGAFLSCLAASFGIKLVRIVLSFFTAGGGSAA